MPKDHPLRPIRQLVDTALLALDEDFDALYAEAGRDSHTHTHTHTHTCSRAHTWNSLYILTFWRTFPNDTVFQLADCTRTDTEICWDGHLQRDCCEEDTDKEKCCPTTASYRDPWKCVSEEKCYGYIAPIRTYFRLFRS